jgi:hypothetical protein
VILYHFDLRHKIEAILRDGPPRGDVWLSDISLLADASLPLDEDFAQPVIEAPDDLGAFEVADNPHAGEGYRELRVPAVLVNRDAQLVQMMRTSMSANSA